MLFAFVGFVGCNSPKECRIEDFNGSCCIDEVQCGNDYAVIGNDSEFLNNECLKLGEFRKPVLCPSELNISAYENCTSIEVERSCKGDDNLWSGAKSVSYEVQCCE